jgi:hypothetical protein
MGCLDTVGVAVWQESRAWQNSALCEQSSSCVSITIYGLSLLANIGKALLEFRNQVLAFAGDADRFILPCSEETQLSALPGQTFTTGLAGDRPSLWSRERTRPLSTTLRLTQEVAEALRLDLFNLRSSLDAFAPSRRREPTAVPALWGKPRVLEKMNCPGV